MNNLLYIGLSGYAGSGKDTVAKILAAMLDTNFNTCEEFEQYYNNLYKVTAGQSATFNNENVNGLNGQKVLCIAYADQLKYVCASIFGIPVERFYMNKSSAWICINKDFTYTEIRPAQDNIITAEEYAYNLSTYKHSSTSYYMSLREILVYVGTYVLQEDINKRIFVNIVKNKINETIIKNPSLKYVIITDNRFSHEIDFMHENNGILISIQRDSVTQLSNVAEHDLDDENSYDYVINNNGTYSDLIETIWDMVHMHKEFENITYNLLTRENINNYLREIDDNKFKLCTVNKLQKIYHENGSISMVDPIGGPTIFVNKPIELYNTDKQLIPQKIKFNVETDKIIISI